MFAFRSTIARQGGRRVYRHAGPPRWRPHSPRNAHDCQGEGYIRRDVRTRAVAPDQGERLADKQMVQEKIADFLG